LGAIDHRGSLGQQLDLVSVLDLACRHDLLAVGDIDTFFFERIKEHRGPA
jgi:hypothetical protein